MSTKTFDASNSTHSTEVTTNSSVVSSLLGYLAIDLSQLDSTFWDNQEDANGADIRIVDDTGTVGGSETAYSFHLENFTNNGDGTGTGILYLDSGFLSTSQDKTFRIYCGDTSLALPADGDTLGSDNVFGSAYKGFWPHGGGVDQTANGNDGNANGGVSAGDTTGPIGKATTYDGGDDYYDMNGVGISGDQARTIHGIVKDLDSGQGDWTNIFGFAGGNTDDEFFDLEVSGSGNDYIIHMYGTEYNISQSFDGNYHHFVLTYDGSNVVVVLDGSKDIDNSKSALSTVDNFHIGQRNDNSNNWNGENTNIAVRDDSMSVDQASTLYEMEMNQSSFWTIGSTTTVSGPPSVETPESAKRINTDQARLYGDVVSDGQNTIIERGFVYSLTDPPITSDNKVTVSGTTGTFDELITGLSENTVYFWRPYAINSEGTSYGAVKYFTTSRQEPSPVNTY